MSANEALYPKEWTDILERLHTVIQNKDVREKMQVEDDFRAEMQLYTEARAQELVQALQQKEEALHKQEEAERQKEEALHKQEEAERQKEEPFINRKKPNGRKRAPSSCSWKWGFPKTKLPANWGSPRGIWHGIEEACGRLCCLKSSYWTFSQNLWFFALLSEL